ncbi:ParB/RepB/Spo0J family partition protein [Herbiconiux sp. SYSU D00978]|uniref:ParB/RepB/Spo0J family partition protein n=1 Tax=Herbiconiux sp. SYSU D00978 TaxID=2812562 RepID=UPI001A970969|nr:ParB/RepB/Spo0J family partition protein [Herbiconiux sp. SYSU D00978]
MAKRTGLGRGIGALIPSPEDTTAHRPVDVFFPSNGSTAATAIVEAPAASSASPEQGPDDSELVAVPGARLASISPHEVVPNANQPRKEFREEELNELIVSIREIGVLQPIVVRPIKGAKADGAKYELVMGERRLRASKAVGLERIPAVIRETDDDAMLRDALLENLHRAELNPLEEASAYQQLLADFGITQEELAMRIGRSRPQITNTIRLLRLPPSVQSRVAAGVLTAGHARAILAVPDTEAMEKLADKIVNEDLSVRAAEAAAGQLSTGPKRKAAAGRKQGQLDEIADRLGDRLNTRVKVNLGVKKGTIVIDFATVGDLNRILGELGEPGFG